MNQPTNETILKVKGTTSVADLGATISHAVYDGKSIVLRCIGAAAVNQAAKGAAVARGYVASRGLNLALIPGFATIEVNGQTVSALIFRVIVS